MKPIEQLNFSNNIRNSKVVLSLDNYKWNVRLTSKLFGVTQDMLGPNERELYNFKALRKNSDKEGIFIDVGAHVGSFAIRLSKYYKAVFAFEPNPYNFDGLLNNIYINKLKNVYAFNFAVSDTLETVSLEHRGGGSKIVSEQDVQQWGYIQNIPTIRLDDVFYQFPIKIIKIDTEGYEEQVIQGGLESIKKYRPVILLETHEKNYYGQDLVPGQKTRLKQMLDELNYSYKVAHITKHGDEHLVCTPR